MNTEQLAEAFRSYRAALEAKPPFDPAPYHWENAPEQMGLEGMAYNWVLDTHTTRLANEINQFAAGTRRLETWGEVLQGYEIQDRMALLVEFINPLAIMVLSFPAAIKGRFIFSSTHLCHLANRIELGWKDNLEPDHMIGLRSLKCRGGKWNASSSLIDLLTSINDDGFRKDTRQFRNRFHHRDAPRLEVGVEATMTRIESRPGRMMHAFGIAQPIQISDVIPSLQSQHKACLNTFKAFQCLVWEQLGVMAQTGKMEEDRTDEQE